MRLEHRQTGRTAATCLEIFWGARLLANPMQLWKGLLARARTNHKTQEAWRDVQLEMILAQRDLAQAHRVTAEAMLTAMREVQACGDVPWQEDELQALFHDAQGVGAIVQASVVGYGNAAVECEVVKVPCFGSHCVTQPPPSTP